MKLSSFHVRTFRNIVDSGPIEVADNTCLVGKNEAGKSALLEALHRLNPARPPAVLNLLDEYPRWLKKDHEISGEIADAIPIEATFELSNDEVATIAEQFGDVLAKPALTASRKYGGNLKLSVPLKVKEYVQDFRQE